VFGLLVNGSVRATARETVHLKKTCVSGEEYFHRLRHNGSHIYHAQTSSRHSMVSAGKFAYHPSSAELTSRYPSMVVTRCVKCGKVLIMAVSENSQRPQENGWQMCTAYRQYDYEYGDRPSNCGATAVARKPISM
jgi:hypothetical protein